LDPDGEERKSKLEDVKATYKLDAFILIKERNRNFHTRL